MQELDKLYNRIKNNKPLGYPTYAGGYDKSLNKFLSLAINNVGDPFHPNHYKSNTHSIERKVIKKFKRLYKAPKDSWGYISNGGTESNLYGLFTARELYKNGIVVYSSDTHYSIEKIIKILNMNSVEISSLHNGEINYSELNKFVKSNSKPVIMVANIGTTMKGAVDDLNNINEILNNKPHYIHADSALFGFILPFVKDPQPFNFAHGIDSVSISGHKMLGATIPCSVFLSKNRFDSMVEYINTIDTTISGSRNGLTPLMLWHSINNHDWKKDIQKSLSLAANLASNIEGAYVNKNSNIVVMPKQKQRIVKKWQLASQGNICHVVVMPSVTKKILNEFVKDVNGK